MDAIATNKRAYFDYEMLDTYEAGIVLLGFEVKAVKTGRVNLAGSYAVIKNGEVWLLNADIPPYQPLNTPEGYDQKRSRRLLLKRSEIAGLAGRIRERGLTLVPLRLYTKHRKIKLEIGLGKSRKRPDKRELLKRREAERELQKESAG